MSTSKATAKAAANSKLKREVEKPEVLPPVEEHIILRVQNASLSTKLKELAQKREPMDDLSIVFSGPRKATLKFANDKHPATLVDLPCIIESQKTWDNRQLYKICDISQMLVVSESDAPLPQDTMEDYVWPHGISAPLHYVRKRRFRKRISKRAIENVEREVERLLKLDAEAISVEREIVEMAPEEQRDLDGDEEEFEEGADGEITPPDNGDEMGSEAGGDEFNIDDEIAAEVEAELAAAEDEEEDEEEEGDQAVEDSDEDDGEDNEDVEEDHETRELREEIAELEGTISEKEQQAQEQMNPIMRARFEGIVKKLNEELAKKKSALSAILSG
ncbi:UNVERIFIED_CONTAM: hypothetical protein HDU68_001011 [Siphonaria sp. JEL0065]|nr:hypothetical protein HDU68_001011 [Siphonaria sp. JEL0065]